MTNSVELQDVSKIYKTGPELVAAVSHVSLAIKRGEMVAIIGPCGSGKSTLMNMIGLLDRPSSGVLKLHDEEITLRMADGRLAALRGKTIGFVFQSFNLLPRLSALANVLVPTSYQKGSRSQYRKRAEALLKKVGLGERMDHKPAELSGGEKQRVAIARSLINNPEIILADEPTGNLDSKSGNDILQLLRELNHEGKTVIIITHDPRIASQCHRVIELLDGQLVKDRRHV